MSNNGYLHFCVTLLFLCSLRFPRYPSSISIRKRKVCGGKGVFFPFELMAAIGRQCIGLLWCCHQEGVAAFVCLCSAPQQYYSYSNSNDEYWMASDGTSAKL